MVIHRVSCQAGLTRNVAYLTVCTIVQISMGYNSHIRKSGNLHWLLGEKPPINRDAQPLYLYFQESPTLPNFNSRNWESSL